MNKRIIEQNLFKWLMFISVAIVIGCLVIVIGIVLVNGATAISIEMITQTSSGGYFVGRGGGILNAIIGSLFLALPATGLAYLIGLGIALYLQRDFLHPKIATLIRSSLDILWGIPSILYGVFCLMIMILLGIGTSLIAGIIALTLLEIPIITRSIDESIKMVPIELKEGSYSLGSTRFETATKVVRKQALPGIIAGVLLGLGRGIGDAASILFTAGFSDSIPTSFMDSTAALPTMIYHLYSSPIPSVRERAYAAAFILLVIVTSISIISRALTKRYKKYVIK
ncbi:MAG: phosphate ABC transporter permease PstA [Candidatus Thermoplasmatota archaeon]|nr:phosphate ABC transporter permease PstA [Candidatus Thermoplasmatota archaeon]